MVGIPFAGATRVEITTNSGIDAPYAAATLAPGGGPGSVTWCLGDPACVGGGGYAASRIRGVRWSVPKRTPATTRSRRPVGVRPGAARVSGRSTATPSIRPSR